MSDDLLRIGPFSRASWLSIKALRAYHEAGLLVPAVVDPANGYRSYTSAQLTDAVIIRRLRDLDVPLDAVGEVLRARDPEVTRKVLAEHGRVLEDRLATTQRALDELQLGLEVPALHTPVHRRLEPAQTVLMVGGQVDDLAEFVARSRATLDEVARTSGAAVSGKFGACYPEQVDDEPIAAVAFLPVTAPPLLGKGPVRVGELPATEVAVLVHHGPLDTLDDSYLNLGAWVATNADSAELPVRELYLDELRTEIHWPLKEDPR
ncbi:MAG: putative MerR family transcriptional regulator [Actinomycetia bacterium]|nr:putative MerR family transcriptional regulator [Actinomycetes bacterium]